jgi:hypothetical protein
MMDPETTKMAIVSATSPDSALVSLHYAYPIIVFGYYIVSSTIAICTLQTKSSESKTLLRRMIMCLLFFNILTYFAQLFTILIRALVNREFPGDQDTIIGLLSCILVFGLEFAGIADNEKPVWYPYTGSFIIAVVFESSIEALLLLSSQDLPVHQRIINMVAVASRCTTFAAAVVVYFTISYRDSRENGTDAERQTLLNKASQVPASTAESDSENGQSSGYGSTAATSDASTDVSTDATDDTDASRSPVTETPESPWERRERQANEQMEKRLKEKGNWFTYAKSFLVSASLPAV